MVKNKITPWVGVLMVVLTGLFTQSLAAAEVTATLDRQQIVEGETVTLVLQTTDPRQSLEAETQPLEQDFLVIDQRTETQMSIVNGRQSASVKQFLTLEPRRSGTLTIPSLTLKDGSQTRPMVLQVEPAPQLAPGEVPPVFLEVELIPREGPHYVHAQLSLKVRIFYQQNLTEAAINAPQPQQASIRLLDEVPYQAERNGNRYRVLERHYAVFPERSGEMTIPPLQLSGRLIERPADRLWQPSVRGRRIRIESEPITLTVQPRPANFSGDTWLPARRVELAQQVTDGETLRVGEPVTRTVILDAVGLEEHMLEEPPWPEIESARIYPDQPQGISRDDGQWVLGHREFRYAVVPEKAGVLVLPEIRLPWWDTINNEERVAILPEHRVEVLASELASNLPPGPAETGQASERMRPGVAASGAGPWRWISLALLLLWLATLTYFLWLRRVAGPGSHGESPGQLQNPDEQALLAAFEQACSKASAREAYQALARWVRRFGPEAAQGSVLGLARCCGHDPLAAAIRELDRRQFEAGRGAETDTRWQGSALKQAFAQWRKQQTGPGKASRPERYDLYVEARQT